MTKRAFGGEEALYYPCPVGSTQEQRVLLHLFASLFTRVHATAHQRGSEGSLWDSGLYLHPMVLGIELWELSLVIN